MITCPTCGKPADPSSDGGTCPWCGSALDPATSTILYPARSVGLGALRRVAALRRAMGASAPERLWTSARREPSGPEEDLSLKLADDDPALEAEPG